MMRLRPADPAAVFTINHPGPQALDRIQSGIGQLAKIEAELEAGLTICESIGRILEPKGITAAALHFDGLAFNPMRYVQPAYSDTPDRVAFYSATFAPEGTVQIDFSTATYGSKNGEPFIHCHAIWRDEKGHIQGGHILPYEAVLARPAKLTAYATCDVAMTVVPDDETNFSLFGVSSIAPNSQTQNMDESRAKLVVVKIRPNEDLVTAIEEVARRNGITSARILSGIGSTAGAVIDGQKVICKLPTELLIAGGKVTMNADSEVKVEMDTILIDVDGGIHRGTMSRGRNPTLICFELFLEIAAA